MSATVGRLPGCGPNSPALLPGCRSLSWNTIAIILLLNVTLGGCSAQKNQSHTTYDPADEAAIASDTPSRFHRFEANEGMDYDPWESFNEKTFSFNFNVLDHYALKPAAEVWSKVFPRPMRQSLANAFDNLAMPRRFVNKVLQGRFPSAGEELARFVLNSTFGVAGLFDVASHLGLQKSDADTGETFALYGIKPGPYLVLPVLQPLTVRDAIGYAADSFMDPLSYFVTPLFADFGRSAGQIINERANNMTMYDDVEDTSLDLYAAVRNGYLQRRRKSIADAICDRDRTWQFISNRTAIDSEDSCAIDR
jgi:phospholipid-binding lipoprotein MlaA